MLSSDFESNSTTVNSVESFSFDKEFNNFLTKKKNTNDLISRFICKNGWSGGWGGGK